MNLIPNQAHARSPALAAINPSARIVTTSRRCLDGLVLLQLQRVAESARAGNVDDC